MKTTSVLLGLFVCLVGVVMLSRMSALESVGAASEPDRSSANDQESPADANTAAAIRRLIPEAAGMRNADMEKLARARTVPSGRDVDDKTLTLMLMMYKLHPPGLYDTQAKEFRFEVIRVPHPSDLVKELGRSRHLGYYSLIQPDQMSDFTCKVDGETAKGTVFFKVPRLWEGKVQYVAHRADDRWGIKEFHMPAHGWKFVRTGKGQWKWFGIFGDLDSDYPPPGQPVSGKITLEGKPLTQGRVEFFHKVAVEFVSHDGRIGEDGRFSTELPVGQYHVVVWKAKPKVPKRFSTPGASGMIVEVTKGKNVFDFELPAEDRE